MDSITYSFSIFWIGIAALAAWILITYTLLLVMSIVCIGFIGVDNPATLDGFAVQSLHLA